MADLPSPPPIASSAPSSSSSAPAPSISSNALSARELAWGVNSDVLLAEHSKENGEVIRTRFPPEPNGYLHIGHAKSMNMNFSLAFQKLGVPSAHRRTVFRYDDTNPDAESPEYIESLRKDVAWLGWTPEKTTYSSDYFQRLYECAIVLIENGKAYVDYMTRDTVEKQREHAKKRAAVRARGGDVEAEIPVNLDLIPGPFRDRSVEDNLRSFNDMKTGKCAEGECTLRLKMDFDSPNPNMHDLMAYRIKYTSHPHVGKGWCIYPSYDYTHGLCDSFEHVDYSICTLEFETRREPYFWILMSLSQFRPKVYEMSRLNLSYTVLSKRKLLKLVNAKYVSGWDDCRMPTISGLRRRGYTSTCINKFMEDIGATRNMNVVEVGKLEQMARGELNGEARRCMAVLDPVKICIVGSDGKEDSGVQSVIKAPNVPTDKSLGEHDVTFSSTVYIDASDYRPNADATFFGLTNDDNKIVGLKYANLRVAYHSIESNEDGSIKQVNVTVVPESNTTKPKSYITWVGNDYIKCEVRLYSHLFSVPEPTDNWEDELNPHSLIVKRNAMVDSSIRQLVDCKLVSKGKTNVSFQFERIGYYVVDVDTTFNSVTGEGELVFNSIVSLKEDSGKGGEGDGSDTSKGAKSKAAGGSGAGASKDIQNALKRSRELQLLIPAVDFFRLAEEYVGKFTKYDDAGFPTHERDGEGEKEVSKSGKKKLVKELEKHIKAQNKAN